MKKRIHPALLPAALVLLGGLAWLLLQDVGNPPVPALPSPGAKAPLPAQARRVGAKHSSPSFEKSRPPSPFRKNVAPPPIPIPPLPPERERTWKVLVKDQATDRPVPDARVYILNPGRSSKAETFLNFSKEKIAEDMEKALAPFPSYRTDRNGVTWVPPFGASGGLAAAIKGRNRGVFDFYGKNTGAPNFQGNAIKPPIVVWIGPEKTLQAQVVDRAGTPLQGVPLRLSFPRKTGLPPYLESLTDYTSGRKGIASFSFRPGFPPIRPGSFLTLEIAVPLKKRVYKVLDPDSLPKSPVRLVLPPTGKVEVQVSRPDGALVLSGAGVAIFNNDPGRMRAWWSTPSYVSRVLDGKAFFPFVGTGTNLRIWAYPLKTAFFQAGAEEIDLNGPARPGETIHASIQLPPPTKEVVLAGRILDSRGNPLAFTRFEASFTFEFDGGGTYSSRRTLQTGRNGTYLFETPYSSSIHGTLVFHIKEMDADDPHEGFLKRDLDLPLGTTYLDILARRAILVASGRVLDSLGKPLRGVSIRGEPPVAQAETSGGTRKESDPTTMGPVYTGKYGDFTLLGVPSTGRVRLTARLPGYTQRNPVTIPIGSKGVRIFLCKLGSLEGSILAPPGFPFHALLILVERKERTAGFRPSPQASTGDTSGKDKIITGTPGKDGTFLLQGLPPGRADVSVIWVGNRKGLDTILLFKAEDVTIPPGEPCRDPKIRVIDLREKVIAFELKPVDSKGRIFTMGVLHYGKDLKQALFFQYGESIILPSKQAGPATIRGIYSRKKRIHLPPASPRILLQRIYPLVIRYNGKTRIPSPPLRLGLRLAPSAGVHPEPLSPPLGSMGYFDEEFNYLRLYVPKPGLYLAHFFLSWGAGGSPPLRNSGLSIPLPGFLPSIQVEDTLETQTFKLGPPKKALQEALKKMGR